MPPPLIHYHQQQPQHQSVTHQQQAASNSSKLGDSQQLTNSVAESAVSKVNTEENSQPPQEALEQVEDQVEATEEAEEPEIDIVINNVVCAFNVRCHLALKEIALHGANVEFKRENGMVTMKLRKPYTTASIWSSGMNRCLLEINSL